MASPIRMGAVRLENFDFLGFQGQRWCWGLVTVPRNRLDGDKGLHGRRDVTNMIRLKCFDCNTLKNMGPFVQRLERIARHIGRFYCPHGGQKFTGVHVTVGVNVNLCFATDQTPANFSQFHLSTAAPIDTNPPRGRSTFTFPLLR